MSCCTLLLIISSTKPSNNPFLIHRISSDWSSHLRPSCTTAAAKKRGADAASAHLPACSTQPAASADCGSGHSGAASFLLLSNTAEPANTAPPPISTSCRLKCVLMMALLSGWSSHTIAAARIAAPQLKGVTWLQYVQARELIHAGCICLPAIAIHTHMTACQRTPTGCRH